MGEGGEIGCNPFLTSLDFYGHVASPASGFNALGTMDNSVELPMPDELYPQLELTSEDESAVTEMNHVISSAKTAHGICVEPG